MPFLYNFIWLIRECLIKRKSFYFCLFSLSHENSRSIYLSFYIGNTNTQEKYWLLRILLYTQKCDRGLQFPLLEICLTHSQEQPHHYYLRPPHPRSHLLQRHYHGITCDVVTHKLIFIHACKAVLHTLCFATQIHATFSSARRPYISCSASRITHSLLLARWIRYPLCIPQRGPYILHSCP